MANLVSYLTALVAFVAVDMTWLGTMSGRFYKPIMGDIVLTKFAVMPAVIFYLLYPIGLVVFAISPALKSGSLMSAVQMGALFGLFTYGTYDLTNQATLRNWNSALTLIDMTWGGVLGAVTAAIAFALTRKLAG